MVSDAGSAGQFAVVLGAGLAAGDQIGTDIALGAVVAGEQVVSAFEALAAVLAATGAGSNGLSAGNAQAQAQEIALAAGLAEGIGVGLVGAGGAVGDEGAAGSAGRVVLAGHEGSHAVVAGRAASRAVSAVHDLLGALQTRAGLEVEAGGAERAAVGLAANAVFIECLAESALVFRLVKEGPFLAATAGLAIEGADYTKINH